MRGAKTAKEIYNQMNREALQHSLTSIHFIWILNNGLFAFKIQFSEIDSLSWNAEALFSAFIGRYLRCEWYQWNKASCCEQCITTPFYENRRNRFDNVKYIIIASDFFFCSSERLKRISFGAEWKRIRPFTLCGSESLNIHVNSFHWM